MLTIWKEILMTKLPPSGAGRFAHDYPAVWESYSALGKAVSEAAGLDVRTRRLLKLAMAIGAGSEGAVHSRVRQAQEERLPAAEIRQVALLAITTFGFPAAMAAYSWIGRGVDAPMPVILLGALGGMAVAGILGMFIGATLFALGYRIFMGWVAEDPDEEAPERGGDTARVD
jgi:alkylhydroperoxidase/carboxymuconolactone decarboxylase family protein YurZ